MTAEFPEVPVENLNMELVGELLARLPAVAAQLRHTSVQSTLGYIGEDPQEPEMAFVRDMLTRPLAEIVAKWYGGHRHAAALGAALTASAMEPGGIRPSSPLA
jgi:hypothetical protein